MKILLAIVCFTIVLAPQRATAREPSVDEVRTAALRTAGLDGRLDRWSGRARWRHLLPEISVDVGGIGQNDRNAQFDEWLAREDDGTLLFDAARNQTENNRRYRTDYSLRADFDLRGLVFDERELASSREARARLAARMELVEQVHDAYFERRAVLAELRESTTAEQARAGAIQLSKLEAKLNALTSGWFGREIRRTP